MSQELLARLATLETELSKLRAQDRKTEPDLAALKAQYIQDPAGFARKHFSLNENEQLHVNRVTLAHLMGDQAPEPLKAVALQGSLVAQQSQLTSTIEDIRRRLDAQDAEKTKIATAESLKALTANKEKYPHLSAAIAANPKLMELKMKGRTGNAEDIAQELEDESREFAAAYNFKPAQPASDNADSKKEAQSKESKSAPLAGTPIGDPPPIPPPAGGPMTPEEDKQIRESLSRKYGLK